MAEWLHFFHLLLLLVVLERVLGGSDLLVVVVLLLVPSFLEVEIFGFGLTFFHFESETKKEWEKRVMKEPYDP